MLLLSEYFLFIYINTKTAVTLQYRGREWRWRWSEQRGMPFFGAWQLFTCSLFRHFTSRSQVSGGISHHRRHVLFNLTVHLNFLGTHIKKNKKWCRYLVAVEKALATTDYAPYFVTTHEQTPIWLKMTFLSR